MHIDDMICRCHHELVTLVTPITTDSDPIGISNDDTIFDWNTQQEAMQQAPT